MELRVGGDVSATAEFVVVETGEHLVARGVVVETVRGDGFVLEAPLGRLDSDGRLRVLEGGVLGQGGGVVMDSQRVELRYDSSQRLVSVEASGEVEVTRVPSKATGGDSELAWPWVATGDTVSVDWLKRRLEVRGDVRFTEEGRVSVGGVIAIPLNGDHAVCEGCRSALAEGEE
ncbi:MAG: hypothetical protein VX519_07235 [Myxococcota bacterium]|nr:hypothetical protein [Myxococcota bacterium]